MSDTQVTTSTVRIPAFAADTLDESLELHAPEAWHARIRALSPRCQYGPGYHRSVVMLLGDMSTKVERGYSALAYDDLCAAERIATRDA